jgi:CHAD domain-containing protein
MRKKKIKVNIKREGKLAKRSLRGFMSKGDQDKLHKFRVGIKKLRAVASLIEQTTTLIGVRNELKAVKETYQLSGKIRDSYLHMELAKKVAVTDMAYLSKEKRVLKKTSRKLRKERPHHLKMLRRAKGRLLKRIPKVKGKNISQFYEMELRGIAGCLSSSTGVEQLHDCRKRLKVLLYNLPLMRIELKVPVNEEYLQQVQSAIGDWHDYVLAADQFPELGDKTKELRHEVETLTENFYDRATTVAKALIETAK